MTASETPSLELAPVPWVSAVADTLALELGLEATLAVPAPVSPALVLVLVALA